jgi:hypothetical protein
MKILRKESGHVLLLPSPWSVRIKSTSNERSVSVIDRAEPIDASKAAVHPETQHCRFYCRWCESPITLPHDSMGTPFGAPYTRKIEIRAIGTVYGSCNHVGEFSLFRGSYGYDTRNNLISAVPHGKTILLDWLRCAESPCSFPLRSLSRKTGKSHPKMSRKLRKAGSGTTSNASRGIAFCHAPGCLTETPANSRPR